MNCPVLLQPGAKGSSKQKGARGAEAKRGFSFHPGFFGEKNSGALSLFSDTMEVKTQISEGACGGASQILLRSLGVLLNLGEKLE